MKAKSRAIYKGKDVWVIALVEKENGITMAEIQYTDGGMDYVNAMFLTPRK